MANKSNLDWWYRKERPANDDGYFENMSHIISQAGLNWAVIEKKWPTTRNAFEQFSVEKIARFKDNDVQRLLEDKGIVRNRESMCHSPERNRIPEHKEAAWLFQIVPRQHIQI